MGDVIIFGRFFLDFLGYFFIKIVSIGRYSDIAF